MVLALTVNTPSNADTLLTQGGGSIASFPVWVNIINLAK